MLCTRFQRQQVRLLSYIYIYKTVICTCTRGEGVIYLGHTGDAAAAPDKVECCRLRAAPHAATARSPTLQTVPGPPPLPYTVYQVMYIIIIIIIIYTCTLYVGVWCIRRIHTTVTADGVRRSSSHPYPPTTRKCRRTMYIMYTHGYIYICIL